MKTKSVEYLQGDVCLVDFNPTLGDEIKKIRPAVIINGNFSCGLGLKIVAPITSWRPDFEKIWWLVHLSPNKQNGLDAESAVNCFQIRCVSNIRIIKKLGTVSNELEEIIATAQNCIEI
ncbi:MAG: type II toxin-antitoxin system PemK/MazF family toxin [Bacteroidota bacterium]